MHNCTSMVETRWRIQSLTVATLAISLKPLLQKGDVDVKRMKLDPSTCLCRTEFDLGHDASFSRIMGVKVESECGSVP